MQLHPLPLLARLGLLAGRGLAEIAAEEAQQGRLHPAESVGLPQSSTHSRMAFSWSAFCCASIAARFSAKNLALSA